jgi:serine protease inhibitor
MSRQRRVHRLFLLATLSLAYGCQATSPLPSPEVFPSASHSPLASPSPTPEASAGTGLAITALTAEESQEVFNHPLREANQRFAFKLFGELVKERGQENLFVSPLGVSLALLMTWNGAREQTKANMEKTLEISGQSPEQVNRGAQLLMRKLLRPAEDIQLEVANAIWANDRFEILPDFKARNEANFLAAVRTTRFKNEVTQAEINNWASQQTHGMIPEVLAPLTDPADIAQFETQTLMYLLNAIYFKANWTEQFERFETRSREFTLANGSQKQVPMMRQFGQFLYLPPNRIQNNHFQAIRLPYGKDKKVGMYLFLPDYGTPLHRVQVELMQMDFAQLLKAFYYERGSLTMPKFKLKDRHNLVPLLSNLGMGDAFSSSQANFLDMAVPRSPDERFYINRAFQMANVEVSEEGTKAAAVTALEPVATPSSEPMRQIEMNLNRPFMYMIVDQDTQQILFMGSVYDPSKE